MGQFERDGTGREIVAAIKEQIHAGTYRPGDRLPSTRTFAADWGASRTTVTAAYGQLIAEGYLTTKPGARAVVAEGLVTGAKASTDALIRPPHLSAFAQRLLASPAVPAASSPPSVADFRYGDLSAADFPVLAWRRAMNTANLRRGALLRYGDPLGLFALRASLQGYLWRARGIRCEPDQIVIVNGSQQGLDLCARLLIDPGDFFIMENPGYLLARRAFSAAGGVAVPIPVTEDGIRTDELPPARVAYVTPSHQFPLGAVLSASRRRALIAWAVRAAAYIVEDDYDGEYRHDIAPIPPLQTIAPEAVIYVGTFSKTLSPTLRLGYLVVPPFLSPAFAEAKRLTDRHTPLFEQEALAELLASGSYERHVRSIRRKNSERRSILLQSLARELGQRARITGANTGLHVVMWVDGISYVRQDSIIASAQDAGIGLYPIANLYDPTEPQPSTIGFVLGYAGLDEATLRRGVKALGRILQKS